MWILWMFAVYIPLGLIHAIYTGEIGLGGRGRSSSVITFADNPSGFMIMIAALCLLEFFLVRALLGIREEERDRTSGQRRRRKRVQRRF